MTVTFAGTGGFDSGTTSANPALPANAEPGHVLVAVVDSGHPTAGTEPSVPAGWRRAGTVVGTSGTYGVDTGPRRLSIFLRLMQEGDTAPEFSIATGSGSRVGAAILAWSFGANESVQWSIALGQDTSAGTGFSAVTNTAVAFEPDDAVLLAYVANTDAATWSGQTPTASGVTFGSVTELVDSQSVVGADASRSIARSTVTSGTGTSAVTLAATLSAAGIGVAGILRLRDTPTDGTAALASASYDSELARVQIIANGMAGRADSARVERSTDAINWTTVRGASAALVVDGALVLPVDDYEFTDGVETLYRVVGYDSASLIPTDIATTSITPDLGGVWLKSTARPFLNAEVDVRFRNPTQVVHPARTGVFDIIGRSNPVTVSDVRKAPQWTMYLRTETYDEATAVRLLLASGDVLYVHTPAGCPTDIIPGGYVTVGDAAEEWHPLRPESRLWILPMTGAAAPGPDVSGTTGTYQTVLDQFATYAEVLAEFATYADLLAIVGSPSEVVVP